MSALTDDGVGLDDFNDVAVAVVHLDIPGCPLEVFYSLLVFVEEVVEVFRRETHRHRQKQHKQLLPHVRPLILEEMNSSSGGCCCRFGPQTTNGDCSWISAIYNLPM